MLLFGNIEMPFSSDFITEEYLYIKKMFSKKPNNHLIELLNYLNSIKQSDWKLSNIEEIDKAFGSNDKIIVKNKEAIYRNYKIYLLVRKKIDNSNVEVLWNLKTLLLISNENENQQKDLNYELFKVLAEHIMKDLEITKDEIEISDKLCEVLSITNSEFISILQNKSSKIMSDFMTTKSLSSIKEDDINKIQNYYDFLNHKGLKYDVNVPLNFLNNYNLYCSKNGIDLIGIKLNVGFPTLIDHPIYGSFDGKVGKMKKTKGQKLFELNPARIYNYLAGFTIAYKYSYLDSFNGAFDTIMCTQIKEYGENVFSNTGTKYLAIQKKGERNPFAIAELTEDEYSIIKASIKFTQRAIDLELFQKNDSEFNKNPEPIDINLNSKLNQNNQLDEKKETQKEPIIEDYISELNKLIGIEEVKLQINSLVNYIKVQKLRSSKDLKTTPISLHSVFSGTPGTGKTTVARLYGGILKQLGVLKKGHLIEVDRSGLVAGYLGQTAMKVDEVVNKSLNGVLFIDEAYSLTSSENDSFGEEAVNILLKKMEDNRDKLVVILAGYSSEMEKFIESNPGLKSRFTRYINFQDYSGEELFEIFNLLAGENEYNLTDNAKSHLKKHLSQIKLLEEKNFGNGRYVRNLFERIVETHSNRIVNLSDPKDEDITTFDFDDVYGVVGDVTNNQN